MPKLLIELDDQTMKDLKQRYAVILGIHGGQSVISRVMAAIVKGEQIPETEIPEDKK